MKRKIGTGVTRVAGLKRNEHMKGFTSSLSRDCDSGVQMDGLNTFYDKAKKEKLDFTQHTGNSASDREDLNGQLYDPGRPVCGSQQQCDNRQHRDIVTAWVKSSFDETIAMLNSLDDIAHIWQQAFLAVNDIAENSIVHRDISFQNIRVDDHSNVKVCDFDMAMFLDAPGTTAHDRTATIAFMASSILSTAPCQHRPIHDFESIFWLCVLELLCKIGVGIIREYLTTIMSPGQSIGAVGSAKDGIVMRLKAYKERTEKLTHYISSKENDWSLLFSLTAIMRELDSNGYANDYDGVKEDLGANFFNWCITHIEQTLGENKKGDVDEEDEKEEQDWEEE